METAAGQEHGRHALFGVGSLARAAAALEPTAVHANAGAIARRVRVAGDGPRPRAGLVELRRRLGRAAAPPGAAGAGTTARPRRPADVRPRVLGLVRGAGRPARGYGGFRSSAG